jgi:hypothetical protein
MMYATKAVGKTYEMFCRLKPTGKSQQKNDEARKDMNCLVVSDGITL